MEKSERRKIEEKSTAEAEQIRALENKIAELRAKLTEAELNGAKYVAKFAGLIKDKSTLVKKNSQQKRNAQKVETELRKQIEGLEKQTKELEKNLSSTTNKITKHEEKITSLAEIAFDHKKEIKTLNEKQKSNAEKSRQSKEVEAKNTEDLRAQLAILIEDARKREADIAAKDSEILDLKTKILTLTENLEKSETRAIKLGEEVTNANSKRDESEDKAANFEEKIAQLEDDLKTNERELREKFKMLAEENIAQKTQELHDGYQEQIDQAIRKQKDILTQEVVKRDGEYKIHLNQQLAIQGSRHQAYLAQQLAIQGSRHQAHLAQQLVTQEVNYEMRLTQNKTNFAQQFKVQQDEITRLLSQSAEQFNRAVDEEIQKRQVAPPSVQDPSSTAEIESLKIMYEGKISRIENIFNTVERKNTELDTANAELAAANDKLTTLEAQLQDKERSMDSSTKPSNRSGPDESTTKAEAILRTSAPKNRRRQYRTTPSRTPESTAEKHTPSKASNQTTTKVTRRIWDAHCGYRDEVTEVTVGPDLRNETSNKPKAMHQKDRRQFEAKKETMGSGYVTIAKREGTPGSKTAVRLHKTESHNKDGNPRQTPSTTKEPKGRKLKAPSIEIGSPTA